MRALLLIFFISSLGRRCFGKPSPHQGEWGNNEMHYVSIPPTGIVNMPAECTWNWTHAKPIGPTLYNVLLVQDPPEGASPAGTFQVSVAQGQTQGTFTVTATRTGTFHLEVPLGWRGPLTLDGRIVITDTSVSATATTTVAPTIAIATPSANGGATQTPSTPIPPSPTTPPPQTVIQSLRITSITVSSTVVIAQSTMTTTNATTPSAPSLSISTITTTSPLPSDNTRQTDNRSPKSSIVGAVLGTVLGVIILALILMYRRHRQRKYNRPASSIAFDRERMVSERRWWTPPSYLSSTKRSHTEASSSYQPESDAISLANSDSQLWSESNVTEKRLSTRPSTKISDKVG